MKTRLLSSIGSLASAPQKDGTPRSRQIADAARSKRRPRWRAAPGGVKREGGRVVSCRLCLSVYPSVPPSVRLPRQTAAELIIQSVSSPWRPDLLHAGTPPDCEAEEIETFAGSFCSGANHQKPTADHFFLRSFSFKKQPPKK